MAYQFPFEKLEVWRLSKDLVKSIYAVTGNFPSSEKYGLSSQINRAAVSVASVIAEGSSRSTRKDQAHYSQMAYGSLMEVACQIMIANDLGYMSAEDYDEMMGHIHKIGNKINALRKFQTSPDSSRFPDSPIPRFLKP